MITTYDIRWGCDVLRPVYDITDGVDGRVSIEVDPRLAQDTAKTDRRGQGAVVAGGPAQHVHQDPGDRRGPPRDHRDPRRGHQRQRHADLLAGALRRGHRRLHGRPGAGRGGGPDISTIASVASFFVSRVDTEVDKRLDKIGTPEAAALRGKAAIANARLAYELYEQRLATARWQALARPGRQGAAAAVGVDLHQGPGLRGHHVRGRAGGPGHGQHHAGGDAARHRRPWQAARATRSTAPTRSRGRSSPSWRSSASATTTWSACSRTRASQKFAASWNEFLGTIESNMAAVAKP